MKKISLTHVLTATEETSQVGVVLKLFSSSKKRKERRKKNLSLLDLSASPQVKMGCGSYIWVVEGDGIGANNSKRREETCKHAPHAADTCEAKLIPRQAILTSLFHRFRSGQSASHRLTVTVNLRRRGREAEQSESSLLNGSAVHAFFVSVWKRPEAVVCVSHLPLDWRVTNDNM